jgi:GT2 family glycosyltransferase
MIDISFVILTWNSEKYLHRCFGSIIAKCQSEKISFEILVVDNGSNDSSVDVFGRYQNDYPQNFVFILLSENTGTTYSRNQGLKRAKGNFICILDSDTELGDGRLSHVFNLLKEDKGIGIIAPRLEYPDGTVQNSVKKFPTFWHKLSKLPKALLKIPVPNQDFYVGFPFATQRFVDSAISACWFFRRDLVETIGLLDEKIFYAPEDLDYCLRVGKAGYRILYLPKFTVIHHTQQISHKKPLSKVSISHFGGLIYYFRKHGGWFSTRSLQRRMAQAQSCGTSGKVVLAENQ